MAMILISSPNETGEGIFDNPRQFFAHALLLKKPEAMVSSLCHPTLCEKCVA
jgi:hypothetical protein